MIIEFSQKKLHDGILFNSCDRIANCVKIFKPKMRRFMVRIGFHDQMYASKRKHAIESITTRYFSRARSHVLTCLVENVSAIMARKFVRLRVIKVDINLITCVLFFV